MGIAVKLQLNRTAYYYPVSAFFPSCFYAWTGNSWNRYTDCYSLPRGYLYFFCGYTETNIFQIL